MIDNNNNNNESMYTNTLDNIIIDNNNINNNNNMSINDNKDDNIEIINNIVDNNQNNSRNNENNINNEQYQMNINNINNNINDSNNYIIGFDISEYEMNNNNNNNNQTIDVNIIDEKMDKKEEDNNNNNNYCNNCNNNQEKYQKEINAYEYELELKNEKINELNMKIARMERCQEYMKNEYTKNMEKMKMNLYTYKHAELKLIQDYTKTSTLYQQLKNKLHEYGIFFDCSKISYNDSNLSRSSLQRRYILFENYLNAILGNNDNDKKKIIIKYINKHFPDIKENFINSGEQQKLSNLNQELMVERKQTNHLRNLAFIFGKRLGLINASEYCKILQTKSNIYIINEDGMFTLKKINI